MIYNVLIASKKLLTHTINRKQLQVLLIMYTAKALLVLVW